MDYQYVVTLLSSAGTSAALAAVLVFLSRSWITERLKHAITHEYAALLETHKAALVSQQQAEIEKIRLRSEHEVENLKHANQVELERVRTALQTETATTDRIRAEVLKWANPILGAVQTLEARLNNILEHEGYVALTKGFRHSRWSVTYEYFMSSTLFAFASYFCWVRMLEERLSFELFRGEEQKDRFFSAIDAVAKALRSFPPPFDCDGPDAQVFALQQRAIGEMMIREAADRPSCLSYHEFEAKLTTPEFRRRLAPLVQLLESLVIDEGCRWTRLSLVLDELRQLRSVCRDLLNLE